MRSCYLCKNKAGKSKKISLHSLLVGGLHGCASCPLKEVTNSSDIPYLDPVIYVEEGSLVVPSEECPGDRATSESSACHKRQVGYWPPRYQSRFVDHKSKFPNSGKKFRKSIIPEKKITLMQLENEIEASMLKQYKENQCKHKNLIFFQPDMIERFNFTFPFRKKRTATYTGKLEHSFNTRNPYKFESIDHVINKNVGRAFKESSSSRKIPSECNKLYDELNKLFMDYRILNHKSNDEVALDPEVVAEDSNSTVLQTQNPLHFSDNAFKILTQNIPKSTLEKQKEAASRNRSHYVTLPHENNILIGPRTWIDISRLLTLFKALQMQSYLQSILSLPQRNDSNKEIPNTKNFLLKDKDRNFMNPFSLNTLIVLPTDFKNKSFNDLRGKKYWKSDERYNDPQSFIQNDLPVHCSKIRYNSNVYNGKMDESSKQDKVKKLLRYKIIKLPSDQTNVHANDLSCQRNTEDTSNDDRQFVLKINNKLKRLTYSDKLRLYNDLSNVTNTLYKDLTLRSQSKYLPENKGVLFENLQNSFHNRLQEMSNELQSEACTHQAVPAEYRNISDMDVNTTCQVNGTKVTESETMAELVNQLMEILNISSASNATPSGLQKRETPTKHRNDIPKENKTRKRILPNFEISLMNSHKTPSLLNIYHRIKKACKQSKSKSPIKKRVIALHNANTDGLAELVGRLTYAYPIPESRMCTTSRILFKKSHCNKYKSFPVNVNRKYKRSEEFTNREYLTNISQGFYHNSKPSALTTHKSPFHMQYKSFLMEPKTQETLSHIIASVADKPRRYQYPVYNKTSIGANPLLYNHLTGYWNNPNKFFNNSCELQQEFEESRRRKCTGCYYIYKDETPTPKH